MSAKSTSLSPRVFIQLLVFILILPASPLLITGRWNWWEGWTYLAINLFGFIVSRWLAARRNPDILAERAKFMRHENTKSWDNLLAPLVGLGGGLVPFVAGLDVRFGWSPEFGLPVKIVALILFLLGYVIASWALMENRFFSGTVRIQTERGHQVVSTGPYSLVRHPGYAGGLLSYLVTPLFLNAAWALTPALLMMATLVVRTALEDRTLQEELPGYKEYVAKTRYRLLPGVW
jgi:protein-S-isoprenylcysteine O-methyltransferase Ste14